MELENRDRFRSVLMDCLLDMGEMMLDCGTEISRIEETLTRIGRAYGAERMDVFVIPTYLVITVSFPENEGITKTRRVRSRGGTDYTRFEKLNALCHTCCEEDLPIDGLRARLDAIARGRKHRSVIYGGSVILAGGYAVFFGGTLRDALAAAVFALMICVLKERLEKTAVNMVAFYLVISLLTGLAAGLLTRLLPFLHMDMIVIGDIMLLIPGFAMTSAVRNIMVGHTISGIVRLAESLVWALALAGGFMMAMLVLQLAGVSV